MVTVELSNGLPIGASYSGKVYDAANNFLLNLPPDRAPNPSEITVPAANVDSNGRVTTPNSNKIEIELNQNEISKFLNGYKVVSTITFNTSGNNGNSVEFRTSDTISIKIYGSVSYKVKP